MSERLSVDAHAPRPMLQPVRDLAGVAVRDASGIPVGRLWGALADIETGLVRYLDVALEPVPRHVLVPIGHARMHEQKNEPEVRLRAALFEELAEIPAFDPDAPLDARFESDVLHAHGRLFHGERYYAHPAFDHRGRYAGTHLIERDTGARADAGLHALRKLRGFRIVRDEPDVRGWPLLGDAGSQLGRISDLIVDVDAQDVRYVVLASDDGRQVLLPIGFLEIDDDAAAMRAPGLAPEDVDRLPAYDGRAVERAFETAVRDALEGSFTGARRYGLPDYRPAPRD